MKRPRLFVPLVFVAASSLAATAAATDYFALRADANELWRIDGTTFAAFPMNPYSLVSQNETAMTGLAVGSDGTIYGMSDAFDQGRLYQFDPFQGNATLLSDLLTGPTGLLGMAHDPSDGTVYWFNSAGFSPAPQVFQVDPSDYSVAFHGNIGSFFEYFAGIAVDATATIYGIETGSNALWTIDKAAPQGPGTFQIGAGFGFFDLSEGATLAYDASTNTFVAYSVKQHALYRVDPATGVDTLVHTFPGTVPKFRALTRSNCANGSMEKYGAGCPGSGGFVPKLAISGCPASQATLQFSLEDGLGGSVAILFLGAFPGQSPVGPNCFFYVAGLAPIFITLPLSPGGPGDGAIAFPATLPPLSPGAEITVQAWVKDPASFIGGVGSNAERIRID